MSRLSKRHDAAEARDQFTADIEFGRWCENSGFGADVINRDTRSSAITMGREPEALRKCLEATERGSLHTIYKFDFSRFRNVSKPTDQPKSRRHKVKQPKTDVAREAVRPLVEAKKPINRRKLAENLGVGENTIQRAEYFEMGRLEALKESDQPRIEPLDPVEMKSALKQRYEATLRTETKRIREQLRIEITTELHNSYMQMIDGVRPRLAHADKIIASQKGVMSRKDFRIVLAGLHPDHNTFERASEAFELFKGLESVLVKPDTPVFSGPSLPTTIEELLARRKSPKR